MKSKKIKWYIIICSVIIIGIISVILFFCKGNLIFKNKFKLNNSNKYEIVTDMKWNTMRNDGGSNTSIYYQVDFDNNIIRKVRQVYEANLGGTPKTTKELIYEKNFDNKIKEQLKALLNDVIKKEDINETKNYSFYEIKSFDYEKKIFNQKTINEIKKNLEIIDNL